MDSIKYRAWDHIYKKMRYWPCEDNCVFWKEGKLMFFDSKGGRLTYELSEPQIFTGKIDKSFREVYEGDLYECQDHILRIEYNERTCQFLLKSTSDEVVEYSLLILDSIDYPRIGNVYEYPEFMKGE